MSDMAQMERLAALVKQKNDVDGKIAEVIGRPTLSGHFGEFVAAEIFGVELHASAVEKGSDGRFASGPHARRTVNVKYYPKNESLLDMNVASPPDLYLVLTGPRDGTAESSRGKIRPWVIEAAYLFETAELTSRLTAKIGIATSVRRELWDGAEIYPQSNPGFVLTEAQRKMLGLFSGSHVG